MTVRSCGGMAPRLADRHDVRDYLADAAAHLLRQRETSYPALVERGALTADDANQKVARARVVADQWRWVIDPTRPLLPDWSDTGHYFGVFDFVLEAELIAAAARARAIADRAPPRTQTPFYALNDAAYAALDKDERARLEAVELADLYEALAWWQHPHKGLARILFDVGGERSRPAPAPIRKAA